MADPTDADYQAAMTRQAIPDGPQSSVTDADYQQAMGQSSPQAPYQPAANPTIGSELARTPEFLKGTLSDIPTEVGNQFQSGLNAMTAPSETWGDFFKSMGRRGAGALTAAGSPLAGVTPLVGHPFTAGMHAVGSVFSPKQASLDVPDTAEHPYGGPEAGVGLLGPINVEQGKPRGLYSQFARPAIEAAQMLQKPSGYSPRGVTQEKFLAGKYSPPDVPARLLTQPEIKKEASAGYQGLRDLGVQIDPKVTGNWAGEVQKEIRQQLGPTAKVSAPKVWAAAGALSDPLETGMPARTIDELDWIKQGIDWAAHNPTEHAEHYAAAFAKLKLADLIDGLQPGQFTSKAPVSAQDITQRLHDARGNWASQARLDLYQDMQKIAEHQTEATGSGANLTNKLRQAAEKLLDRPSLSRGIPQEEKEQLEKVVQGTTTGNVARTVGKLAPTGAVSIIPHLLTAMIHPSLPALTAGLGHTAKHIGEVSTERQWQKVLDLASRSAPATQAQGTMPRPALRRTAIPSAVAAAHRISEGYQP